MKACMCQIKKVRKVQKSLLHAFCTFRTPIIYAYSRARYGERSLV